MAVTSKVETAGDNVEGVSEGEAEGAVVVVVGLIRVAGTHLREALSNRAIMYRPSKFESPFSRPTAICSGIVSGNRTCNCVPYYTQPHNDQMPCDSCAKAAKASAKLNQCARCKAVAYCDKV